MFPRLKTGTLISARLATCIRAGSDSRASRHRVSSLHRGLLWLSLVAVPLGFRADGPADNRVDQVRPVPPPGISVPDDVRRELVDGLTRLRTEISITQAAVSNRPPLAALLPDVEIFHKSVDWALRFNEVFRTNDFNAARVQINEGLLRAAQLRDGQAAWASATGLVVRAYRSRIDDSIQPYGLVVPSTFQPGSGRRHRLDFWFHGRGEQLSELAFLSDRMRSPGEFTPPDAFVLHLYGRYCNGSRFAGETDFWEAFEEVTSRYPIDTDRLVVRGFSLGGASCWHMATHHASRWAAAAPGAGFSETAEFLNVFQNEKLSPAPWEQKLWRLYDSTSHARNVAMVPLVAYSGEDDRQIQAARAMEKAMQENGLTLTHIIGPKTGHSYERGAREEINRRINAAAAHGRDPLPRRVHFVTHSLRYNSMAWVTVDGLKEHWEPAHVEARMDPDKGEISLETRNVESLTLRIPPGLSPFDPTETVRVRLDADSVSTQRPASDRSWVASFRRVNAKWESATGAIPGLRKRHGLQGPIDDAFMDSFLFVRPTGTASNPEIGNWTQSELQRAVVHWRKHYRGEVRIKDDTAVTEDDIRRHHLVVWGDPSANQFLARWKDKLPLRWEGGKLTGGGKSFDAAHHVPLLIHPNPANPARYIVLNSSFTFREYDYLNNARQTPKLPDWAIVDIRTPANSRHPGLIADAGFFSEEWNWK